MQSVARWTDGLQFEGTFSCGHPISLDTSAEQGGGDSGPRPVELLLMGLAGCTGMDVIAILKKKRLDISSFAVRVTGERREEHPRIFEKIHVVYEVGGAGIDRKAVEQAVLLSEEKYCSVSAMLGKVAEITNEIRILPA